MIYYMELFQCLINSEFWFFNLLNILYNIFQDSNVNAESRNQIVRWLAHLTKKFKFLPETFALAVDVFDRLLQVVKVGCPC